MSPGPCDFTAELKAPTSISAAQGERMVRMCVATSCLPGHSSTMKLHLQRPKLPRGILTPPGVPSLHYDMGLCLQSHFGRFWGFFLAESPQRVKLQKRNSQRRTCLPQNLRDTKTRWLHFQRPKWMGQEVSQYNKRGLRPLCD